MKKDEKGGKMAVHPGGRGELRGPVVPRLRRALPLPRPLRRCRILYRYSASQENRPQADVGEEEGRRGEHFPFLLPPSLAGLEEREEAPVRL